MGQFGSTILSAVKTLAACGILAVFHLSFQAFPAWAQSEAAGEPPAAAAHKTPAGEAGREPGELPIAEPKALLAPARLIPVEESAVAPVSSKPVSNKPVSNRVEDAVIPPVRLAPEPLPQRPARAREISNSVEGIRPASFKELTPGQSTREDVTRQLGEPRETTAREGQEELVFKLGPFPSVKITIQDKIVSSIVLRLAEPTAREDVVVELGLEEFEPVPIHDDSDRPLGEVYPERGLMFAYQGKADAQGQPRVGQIVLERVSVEPFLLRVEKTPARQLTKRLDDLRIVQQLVPDDPEAYALAAELDQRCGRLTTASEAAHKALELDPDEPQYRILVADLDRQLGRHRQALSGIRAVLSLEDLEPLEEAKAQYILGRLLAARPHYDYRQGMQETVTAIKLAAAEVGDSEGSQRRRARRLLIRTQLSLAEILCYGPWEKRHEVVPQWLASAEKAADEHVERDGAARDVLLELYDASLHCLLVLDGRGSPTKIADTAIDLGRELIAQSDDVDYQSLIEWKLGVTLLRAARIEQQQGRAEEAMRLANNAEALLSAAGKLRSAAPGTQHHLAQAHFLLGSLHAIYKRDDTTAAYWYDKALTHMTDPYPDSLMDQRGPVGEQLVSVGISLWETGRRNKAVSVTEQGTALISEAIEAGSFKSVALGVPCQNLAEMYRKLGREDDARKMARKAAQYDSSLK